MSVNILRITDNNNYFPPKKPQVEEPVVETENLRLEIGKHGAGRPVNGAESSSVVNYMTGVENEEVADRDGFSRYSTVERIPIQDTGQPYVEVERVTMLNMGSGTGRDRQVKRWQFNYDPATTRRTGQDSGSSG